MKSEEQLRKELEKLEKEKLEVFSRYFWKRYPYTELRKLLMKIAIIKWVLSDEKKPMKYFLRKENLK